jgi:hypothetical protein
MSSALRSFAAMLIMGLSLAWVNVQAQSAASEPFKPVDKSQLMEDASPALLERLDTIERLPTTKEVYTYRINPDIQLGDHIKISIPNGSPFNLSRTGGEHRDSKDFTWFGALQGDDLGTATLVDQNGEIAGSINSSRGLYRITPLGNRTYALVKVETKSLPQD